MSLLKPEKWSKIPRKIAIGSALLLTPLTLPSLLLLGGCDLQLQVNAQVEPPSPPSPSPNLSSQPGPTQSGSPSEGNSPMPTPQPSTCPNPNPSPTSTSRTPLPPCSYATSLTYDLGTSIDVTQSFEVISTNGHPIEVTELVLQSNMTGCPPGVQLPQPGESDQKSAFAIESENGQISLFATPFSQPALFTVQSTPTSAGTSPSMTLSMTPSQISNGNEVQLFDSGTLQSNSSNTDAAMVLQLTYTFAPPRQSTPFTPGW